LGLCLRARIRWCRLTSWKGEWRRKRNGEEEGRARWDWVRLKEPHSVSRIELVDAQLQWHAIGQASRTAHEGNHPRLRMIGVAQAYRRRPMAFYRSHQNAKGRVKQKRKKSRKKNYSILILIQKEV
jgi:hypothetical protein